jgi:D-alanyl-D-alanine carboxypeptidase/D-alanyl-D-alanine-endopeptidase (penicillin-binding protein 4)
MTFIRTIHRVLIVAVCLCAVSSTLIKPTHRAGAQAQRDRRTVVTEPTHGPVPSPATSPIASRSIPASRSAPATPAELQSRIQEIVRQPALEPGFFAVKIVSLDTGLLIYEQNANKFTRPASNMKLYTVAAALDRLTPDYHFITSV